DRRYPDRPAARPVWLAGRRSTVRDALLAGAAAARARPLAPASRPDRVLHRADRPADRAPQPRRATTRAAPRLPARHAPAGPTRPERAQHGDRRLKLSSR